MCCPSSLSLSLSLCLCLCLCLCLFRACAHSFARLLSLAARPQCSEGEHSPSLVTPSPLALPAPVSLSCARIGGSACVLRGKSQTDIWGANLPKGARAAERQVKSSGTSTCIVKLGRNIVRSHTLAAAIPISSCRSRSGRLLPQSTPLPRCESHRNCVLLTRLTRASIRFESLARSIRSNWPQCCLACFTASWPGASPDAEAVPRLAQGASALHLSGHPFVRCCPSHPSHHRPASKIDSYSSARNCPGRAAAPRCYATAAPLSSPHPPRAWRAMHPLPTATSSGSAHCCPAAHRAPPVGQLCLIGLRRLQASETAVRLPPPRPS